MLTGVALAVACLCSTPAWALGLGRLSVQSALGETLRAEIDVTSIAPEEAASLRLRVAAPEAYRAQGVEYNAALTSAQVQLVRRPDGRSVLRVTSDRAVLEPFVDVIIEASWTSGRLVREYTMLFDPPGTRTAQTPAASTAAVVTAAPAAPTAPVAPSAPAVAATQPAVAAPAPSAAPVPAQASTATPANGERKARPTPPARSAPGVASAAPAAPAAPADAAGQHRVRAGESLSRIAGQVLRPGVSLDQMLVSLFRANPQAFMGDNMNRLKSGVVLAVPSADDVAKITPQQAREIIVAQSSDFAAYRQRLAAGTTTVAEAQPPRQATGRVQAQVEDRRPAAAAPDRLTLTQGAVKPAASDPRPTRETERKDQSARLQELSRNVEELKKLQQGAAGTPAPAVAVPSTPSAASAPTTPAVAVAPPLPASAPAPATVASAAPPKPVAKPTPKPAPAPEPSWLDAVLENPLLLPGAGVLVALLAGLGLYRMRGRLRKAGSETSFLESRLQPDSFFGASGGQRIDTREAPVSSQGSSSMSYSLSQLDAIGDVDPVAEADVYLAYGRDLQAEEILKEAMRASPDRLAIRTKLLEVYAKRRDAKGFELLATQLHSLTQGEGEEWAKAQQLGQTIDPDNVLYQPGGHPEAVLGSAGKPVEPLGASTMPYTAPVGPAAFQPAADARLDTSVDVDLDLAGPPSEPALSATEATQVLSTSGALDFDLETPTVPMDKLAPAEEPLPSVLDFDLGELTAEPPAPAPAVAPAPATPDVPLASSFGDFALGSEPIPSALPDDADPLARKLELAEEFRQIGDLEGARDLLEEVMAKAEGALRSKARAMLDKLE